MLIDENLPIKAAKVFNQFGYDTETVSDEGLQGWALSDRSKHQEHFTGSNKKWYCYAKLKYNKTKGKKVTQEKPLRSSLVLSILADAWQLGRVGDKHDNRKKNSESI